MTCPDPRCKYKTPHAHRMTLHVDNTGHGRGGGKEFKGYKQPPKKVTPDSAKNGGGGKKKGGR